MTDQNTYLYFAYTVYIQGPGENAKVYQMEGYLSKQLGPPTPVRMFGK